MNWFSMAVFICARAAGKWWETLITEYYTAGEGEFFDLPEATRPPG